MYDDLSMKKSFSTPLLLLASVTLLASCNASLDSSSSSSEQTSSSIPQPNKDIDDYLNEYTQAMKFAAMEQDLSFDAQGSALSFGFRSSEAPEEGKERTWNDLHLDTDHFGVNFAANGVGRGKDKMKASLHMPRTELRVSGNSIPSAIGSNAVIPLQMDAYFDNATLYADFSKQGLFNTVLQVALRGLSGDSTWNLVDQGHYDLSDDAFSLLTGLINAASSNTPEDRFFRLIAETDSLMIPVQSETLENGLSKMTVRIDDEASLDAYLNVFVSNVYAEIKDLVDSFKDSSSSSIDIGVDLPSEEEVLARVDETIEAIDFNHFYRSVTYAAEQGVVAESFSLSVDDFDDQKTYDLLYGANGIDPFDPNDVNDADRTLMVPDGKLEVSCEVARAYGRKVKCDTLSVEEKADYTDVFTFPKFQKEEA